MFKILLLFLALSITIHISAQENEEPSPIIFIYDASGSMWGQMQGKTKMEIAADVLTSAVNNLPEDQKIGFVAYGHRKKGDCSDVEFLVDVEKGSKTDVAQALSGIKPLGKTPLAYSALQVIDKLRQSALSATIILITDGIESCDGNICDVIKEAKEEGIDFKLHIIGFGLKDGDTQQLKCAAQAGDGEYYDATDADMLGDVLNEATTALVDATDNNFSVHAVKNGMAIDARIMAYDVIGKRKAVRGRTYRDTAHMYLPPSTYRLEVYPMEGSDVDMITVLNVQSFEDQMVHKTIFFDGGKLGISVTNNGNYWDCSVRLIDTNGNVAALARTYRNLKEVEVNPGTYKVTIQALKMEGLDTYTEFENVEIVAGSTTPLSYDFKTGNLDIYVKAGGQNIDAVVTVNEEKSGTNVARSRSYTRGSKFLLNPGIYKVKVSPLREYKDRPPQTITVVVKTGELVTKELKF